MSMLGPPELGTYTFSIKAGDASGTASDDQSTVIDLPPPDSSAFSPADRETVPATSPTFSWEPVEAGIPVHYRLDIRDMGGDYVYRSAYAEHGAGEDRRLHVVPAGYLKPGEAYLWRVRVVDEPGFVQAENRANSNWVGFTVSSGAE